MKTIPIFFTFDNNYVELAAVAFYSLLNKANPDIFYEMYVIHSDITSEKQTLLNDIIKRFNNANLHFVSINDFLDTQLDNVWNNGSFASQQGNSKFTSDTLARCFAARFFPQYDKIIYSDVDVVFVDDISELYDVDLSNKYIAGVKNPFMKFLDYELSHLSSSHYNLLKDSYIGGGIWVMNLKKIREDKLESRMMQVINDTSIVKRWNDQDIINISCEGKVAHIPLNYISYPYLPELLRNPDFTSHYTRDELYDSIINPKIVHYAASKPWNNKPEYSNLWWMIFDYLELPITKIFEQLPQKNEEVLINRERKRKRKLKKKLKLVSLLALLELIALIILFFIK